MGNVVSYFLTKPEAAAVERGNAEDKGKKIEEAAVYLEQEITAETSTVITTDGFEVIQKGNVNDICYEAENVVENMSKELQSEISCKDEIENKENVEIIKLIQENISESTEEDVLCLKPGAKEETQESTNKTSDSVEIIDKVPEVESVAREVEPIGDTEKDEEVEVNGCIKDIHQGPAKLEIETVPETVHIEDIKVIGNPDGQVEDINSGLEKVCEKIHPGPEESSENPSLEQDSPEIIKIVQDSIPETSDMDTDHMSQAFDEEEQCADTGKVADIEYIGSIEEYYPEETLKQEDCKQSVEEPSEQESKPLEEKAYEPEIEDSFSKIIDDCKMQVENIQNNMVGLGKEGTEDSITTDDVCSCPHPELSKLESKICHCPHPELTHDTDVCHCSHPELDIKLDENCCRLVENGNTKATTPFLVDESGKTVNQLVYDLSEEHYGFEVMKESLMKFPEENLCNSCSCECDSETAGGDSDKKLDLPASIQDIESELVGAKAQNHEDSETVHDTEGYKEQAEVERISKTEMEVDLDLSEDVPDYESGICEVESKIEVSEAITQNMAETEPISLIPEPIKENFPEPNRIPSPPTEMNDDKIDNTHTENRNHNNEDDEACSDLISATE